MALSEFLTHLVSQELHHLDLVVALEDTGRSDRPYHQTVDRDDEHAPEDVPGEEQEGRCHAEGGQGEGSRARPRHPADDGNAGDQDEYAADQLRPTPCGDVEVEDRLPGNREVGVA